MFNQAKTTWRWRSCTAALLATFAFTAVASDGYSTSRKSAGLGLENRHQAKRSAITPDNVSKMRHEWTYYTTDDGAEGDYAGAEAMPLLHGGVLYFPTTDGHLHAVDAKTGERVWRKSFRDDYSDVSEGRIVYNSRNTPIVRGNVIYTATNALINMIGNDGGVCETNSYTQPCIPAQTGTFLLAINRLSGDLISATQLDDSAFSNATASPILYKNRIIVTLSSIEEISADANDPDIGLPLNDPDAFLRCCRFRGKTVAVDLKGKKLASSPAWTFYHVPSFDGPNNKSRLPAGHPDRSQFEADLAAFDSARAQFLADLDPSNARYLPLGDPLPQNEKFSGAGSWARGNPAVDKERGIVLVSPGSNYGAPDLYRQCERVRQGNIAVLPGNQDSSMGDLDPEAYLSGGLHCDNLNQRLDNYVNNVVAIDIETGQARWAMRPEELDANPDLHRYDVWNNACLSVDLGDLSFGPFIASRRGTSPFFDLDFAQQTQCDTIVKPDDYGFGQQPMILRSVEVAGGPMDIGVIGQKSGALYRFDLDTGGQLFYDRQKFGDGGVLAGISWPGASDGEVIYTAINNSANNLKDIRRAFYSARDDDVDNGGNYGPHRGDPRLPGKFGGPRVIVEIPNPSASTFVDADVMISYDDLSCAAYAGKPISTALCNGIDPFTMNNNPDPFRINEFGNNPYHRKVVVVRDWRDQALGAQLGGVDNPNQVENPMPENVASTLGNKILTVRDLNDCSNPADPMTCAIKTVAGFWLAMDASSGDVLWTTTHPGGSRIHSQLTLSGDVLYSGAQASEKLYVDEDEFPGGTLTPVGGGLRYAFDKDTGEILFRFHDELEAAGIGVSEYVSCHPLVHGQRVFWGSGAGHYIATVPDTAGNALHSFRLEDAGHNDD